MILTASMAGNQYRSIRTQVELSHKMAPQWDLSHIASVQGDIVYLGWRLSDFTATYLLRTATAFD